MADAHRCFQVFKIIHQLVDAEEDILMVSLNKTTRKVTLIIIIIFFFLANVDNEPTLNFGDCVPSNRLH